MGGVRMVNVNVRSGEIVISVGVGRSGRRWAVRALLRGVRAMSDECDVLVGRMRWWGRRGDGDVQIFAEVDGFDASSTECGTDGR